jgi:hypothetical protein
MIPSRRANAACVSPLCRHAATNSFRRPAGVILRPWTSRFSPVSTTSIVAVVLVTITTAYVKSLRLPTRYQKRRLRPTGHNLSRMIALTDVKILIQKVYMILPQVPRSDPSFLAPEPHPEEDSRDRDSFAGAISAA